MPKDTTKQLTPAARLHHYVTQLEGEHAAITHQLDAARRRAAEPPPPAFDEAAARAELARAETHDIATGERTHAAAVLRHAAQRDETRKAAEAHAKRVAAAQAEVERLSAQLAELDAKLAEARRRLDEEIRAAAAGMVPDAEQRLREASAEFLRAMTALHAVRMLAAEGEPERQRQFSAYFASLPPLDVWGKDERPEGDDIPPTTRGFGDLRALPIETMPVVRACYERLRSQILGGE